MLVSLLLFCSVWCITWHALQQSILILSMKHMQHSDGKLFRPLSFAAIAFKSLNKLRLQHLIPSSLYPHVPISNCHLFKKWKIKAIKLLLIYIHMYIWAWEPSSKTVVLERKAESLSLSSESKAGNLSLGVAGTEASVLALVLLTVIQSPHLYLYKHLQIICCNIKGSLNSSALLFTVIFCLQQQNFLLTSVLVSTCLDDHIICLLWSIKNRNKIILHKRKISSESQKTDKFGLKLHKNTNNLKIKPS